MDTRFWCPRGGTGAVTTGMERCIAFDSGEWRQVAWRSGCFRSLLFVPGGRRDAWLSRSMIFRPDLPECAAEAPRSVWGQPTFPVPPAGLGAREKSSLACAPARLTIADRQDTTLSTSGG
ncbi:MAG: hypothetical protein ABFC57_05690 [Veillonellales bacterium]